MNYSGNVKTEMSFTLNISTENKPTFQKYNTIQNPSTIEQHIHFYTLNGEEFQRRRVWDLWNKEMTDKCCICKTQYNTKQFLKCIDVWNRNPNRIQGFLSLIFSCIYWNTVKTTIPALFSCTLIFYFYCLHLHYVIWFYSYVEQLQTRNHINLKIRYKIRMFHLLMLLPDEKTMWAQKLPMVLWLFDGLNGHHISLELRNNANNNVDGLDCDHQGSCIKYYVQYTTKP